MTPILAVLTIVAALVLSPMAYSHEGHAPAASAASAAQYKTQAALRDLWVEHIFWVRNYVLASKSGDKSERKVAADQILANAGGLSGAIAAYYGKPAGDKMLTLLAGHWGAIKEYSDATFDRQGTGQQEAAVKLMANAKEIAAFLAKANPNLPEATLVGLLAAHGGHHIAQIQEVARGDYAAEAQTWASMRAHMFVIADAMATALAKQFPKKF